MISISALISTLEVGSCKSKQSLNILSAICYTDNRHCRHFHIGDLQYDIIIHRNNAKPSAMPWLFLVFPIAFRHTVQAENHCFQTFKLSKCMSGDCKSYAIYSYIDLKSLSACSDSFTVNIIIHSLYGYPQRLVVRPLYVPLSYPHILSQSPHGIVPRTRQPY